ncbi:MAG: HAD family hydrolase [Chloroflexota bacterium]|nr:HAD family hydrolase [Chloroflexota bacterium]
MNNEIKLVAIDLDGTLLNSKHALSARNRSAIKSAQRQGVEVVLATGKTRHAAEDLIDSLGIDSPGIYMQGLITYNADGSVRTRIVMDQETVSRVIALGEEFGFGALAYSDNRAFALRVDEFAIKMTEYGEPHVETIADWLQLLDTFDINKVVLYGEENQVTTLRQAIDARLDGAVHVTRANVAGMIEVLPANTSKGQAVKTLLEELGMDPSKALAVGDGENDIEMLQTVGIGVAMDNATQMLKDAADVIVPNNDEDGVAVALEEFVLGEKAAQK